MVMMLSTGAILTIAALIFAGYSVFSWLCRTRQAPNALPAPAAGPPSWLTPVVLVGMVVFGLRSGMHFFLVVFGSVFVVVMLVKLNVLTFGDTRRPTATMPPPLPRDRGFPNATYHPTFAPPPRQRSGSRVAGFVTALLLAGGLLLGIAATRMEVAHAPRNLEMVVSESWQDAMRDAHVELQQGMTELNHELKAGAHEMAQEVSRAAAEFKRSMQRVPPPPPTAPPTAIVVQEFGPKPPTGARPADLPPPGKAVSPAIQATEQKRIDAVMGRQGGGKTSVIVASKGKKESKKDTKRQPAAVERVPAVRVDYDRTTEDLAKYPTNEAPNGAYVLLTNPNDQRDGYLEAYQRGLVLLKNHVLAQHTELGDGRSLELPPLSWAEANGLAHRRIEQLEGGRGVLAVGANFSPKSVELAYNYHLGCVRTREAAKGYFGGLLCLGGLGLLLRIGTGVRPTAPVPKV